MARTGVLLAAYGGPRNLDEVAYLRFASVYRSFDSLDDFEQEIALLRTEADLTTHDPAPAEPSTT